MKHLLGSWLSTSRGATAPAPVVQQILRLEVPSSARWEPIPDDVAEWMGMRPYIGEQEQQAAS
jgi:hypothetical protein